MGPALSRYVGKKAERRRWRNEWRAELPYEQLADDQIAALPVGDWLADDAWCVLWVVTSRIEAAPSIMRSWKCKVRGWWCWHKDGGPQWPGGWCHNLELLLIGSRGRPRWSDTKGFPACFRLPRVRLQDVDQEVYRQFARRAMANGATHPPPRYVHSAKPPEFYRSLAARTEGPRLDVFARRAHPGWDAIGDESP